MTRPFCSRHWMRPARWQSIISAMWCGKSGRPVWSPTLPPAVCGRAAPSQRSPRRRTIISSRWAMRGTRSIWTGSTSWPMAGAARPFSPCCSSSTATCAPTLVLCARPLPLTRPTMWNSCWPATRRARWPTTCRRTCCRSTRARPIFSGCGWTGRALWIWRRRRA